jgi:hypothetical protein
MNPIMMKYFAFLRHWEKMGVQWESARAVEVL